MLKLVSNGFFKNRILDIDYHEDIEFNESERNDSINVMVDNYDFDMNDLKDLQTVDIARNPFKDHFVTEEEYNSLAVNYYINYDRQKDLLSVIISVYDFDFADDEIVLFLNKFERQIEIIISTKEEHDLIIKKFDDYCNFLGYKDLKDFFKKECDEYTWKGVNNE